MVLNKVVISENPDIVFIFFGANDAIDASVKQHVPINQFAHNIRLMIRELKSVINIIVSEKTKTNHLIKLQNIKGIGIVLITPPPVWEEQLMATNLLKGKPLASDRSNIRCNKHSINESLNFFFTFFFIKMFYRLGLWNMLTLAKMLELRYFIN